MNEKKIFTEGFWFYDPKTGAPSYIIGSVVIDIERFKNFMFKNQTSDRMRLSIKRSKSGNIYTEIDTYDPTKRAPRSKEEEDERKVIPEPAFQYPEEEISIEDVPF